MLTMSIDKDYYVYNYGSRSVRWTGKSDRVPKNHHRMSRFTTHHAKKHNTGCGVKENDR